MGKDKIIDLYQKSNDTTQELIKGQVQNFPDKYLCMEFNDLYLF